MARNPFRPTAGATPPLLVGRDDAMEEFTESLEDGPGAPGRLALFTGPRGVGKTVMLTEVGDQALSPRVDHPRRDGDARDGRTTPPRDHRRPAHRRSVNSADKDGHRRDPPRDRRRG